MVLYPKICGGGEKKVMQTEIRISIPKLPRIFNPISKSFTNFSVDILVERAQIRWFRIRK